MREFCTATELNAHKQSPCEPPTAEEINSMMKFSAEMMANNDEASQMENRIDQPISMANLPHGSHAQFRSIVGQMQRMNGPMRKKTLGPFPCEICGRIFMKNSNLTKHRTIHTDEKPFECWLCHKM